MKLLSTSNLRLLILWQEVVAACMKCMYCLKNFVAYERWCNTAWLMRYIELMVLTTINNQVLTSDVYCLLLYAKSANCPWCTLVAFIVHIIQWSWVLRFKNSVPLSIIAPCLSAVMLSVGPTASEHDVWFVDGKVKPCSLTVPIGSAKDIAGLAQH